MSVDEFRARIAHARTARERADMAVEEFLGKQPEHFRAASLKAVRLRQIVQVAILAERERAATIVEPPQRGCTAAVHTARQSLAEKIRNGDRTLPDA